jgi:hypothetical protein
MSPVPTRRWFRWSLRTMFVVVTVVALAILSAVQAVKIHQLEGQIEYLRYQNSGLKMNLLRHPEFVARHPEMFGSDARTEPPVASATAAKKLSGPFPEKGYREWMRFLEWKRVQRSGAKVAD